MHTCKHVCGGQRSFESRSHRVSQLELVDLAELAGLKSKGPPLPPQNRVTIHLACTWLLGWKSGSYVCSISTLPAQPSPSPQPQICFCEPGTQDSLIMMIKDLHVYRMEIISVLYFSSF